MNNYSQLLEVVDNGEKAIGLESRDIIHKKGLLHREIHIWFVTPAGEVVFQHRGENKDTHPNQLDATVGGHVEPGSSYEAAAVKECLEETGLKINTEDLILLAKIRKRTLDESTGKINNVFRCEYAYRYRGGLDGLRVEKDEALGFEKRKIGDLSSLSAEEKKKFVPAVIGEDTIAFLKKAEMLLAGR